MLQFEEPPGPRDPALCAEASAVASRYARRMVNDPRYNLSNPAALWAWQDRQRAILRLLVQQGWGDLGGCRMLEVGCGTGNNLLEWLLWGAQPEHLVGMELLPQRHQLARERLPQGMQLLQGDATALLEAQASNMQMPRYDIILQATVFSSLLDPAVQQRLACAMWAMLKPGGAVIWYDITVDNPFNPDVRGVPFKRVKGLFPYARGPSRRLTLAPPLSRILAPWHPALCSLFNWPFLRTHCLAWLGKSPNT